MKSDAQWDPSIAKLGCFNTHKSKVNITQVYEQFLTPN